MRGRWTSGKWCFDVGNDMGSKFRELAAHSLATSWTYCAGRRAPSSLAQRRVDALRSSECCDGVVTHQPGWLRSREQCWQVPNRQSPSRTARGNGETPTGSGQSKYWRCHLDLAPAKNLRQTRHHPQSPSPDGEESLARTRRNGPAAP